MENERIVYFIDGSDSDSVATAGLLQSPGIVSRRVSGGVAGFDQPGNREPGCILVDIDAHGIDAAAILDALPARRAVFPVVVICESAPNRDHGTDRLGNRGKSHFLAIGRGPGRRRQGPRLAPNALC